MKRRIKKLASTLINFLSGFIRDHNKRASLYSTFSRWFVDKNNRVIYDNKNSIYWFKNNDVYLYAENEPTFNFNLIKLKLDAERICCKFYKPKLGDVVIDVGAGVGTELVYFISKVGQIGKIYCLEASPSTFKKLELLSINNKFKNTFSYNIAITASNGEVWIEEMDAHEKAKINNSKHGTSVKSITLDDFILKEKIDKVDYLKVNIEGAEEEMLEGMKTSISIIENVAISCHDFLFKENNSKIRNKVIAFLKSNGFVVFENNTGHKVVDSWVYGKRQY
jgi:FkbM family methyltransferase